MKKIEFYPKWSVASGFEPDEFVLLDEKIKKDLLILISRISEKSYRRGFQHGKLLQTSVDPYIFRNKPSLDKSPYTDTFNEDGSWSYHSGFTSLERLWIEYGVLVELGLRHD